MDVTYSVKYAIQVGDSVKVVVEIQSPDWLAEEVGTMDFYIGSNDDITAVDQILQQILSQYSSAQERTDLEQTRTITI